MMGARIETYNATPEIPGGCMAVIILGALIIGGIVLAMVLPDGTEVKTREHAVQAHGQDAEAVRRCLEQNGPNSTWKFRPGKKEDHYAFCAQLDDERWGVQIAQDTKKGWLEKTAFIIKDGDWGQLVEYLSARAIEILSG